MIDIDSNCKLLDSGYELNCAFGSTLIDLYAKQGSINNALRLFERLPDKDVVAWSSFVSKTVSMKIFAKELGSPLESLFSDNYEEPIAAASVGQVYFAFTNDTVNIVEHVQHHELHHVMVRDIYIADPHLGNLRYNSSGQIGTSKFICKRSYIAYYYYCVQTPDVNVSTGHYFCTKHTRCHRCVFDVPRNALNIGSFMVSTGCDDCGGLSMNGNCCPVCLKVPRIYSCHNCICL